jgi:type I restriction enzyme S subunit
MIKAIEYCDNVFDGTHSTPKPLKSGKPLVLSKNILNEKLDIENLYYISKNDFNEINKRSQVSQWDILFSMIGSIGNIYLENSENIEYAIKNIGVFSCKNEKKAKYLYYYLKSPLAKTIVKNYLVGAVQKFLPLSFLRNFPVPEYDEKKYQLIKILSSLDNKIELNKKINNELENLAKMIYKYLFVQNEDKKWEKKKLIELGELKNGINYKKANIIGEEIKIVNVRNISASSMFIDVKNLDKIIISNKEIVKYFLDENDIIIARSGVPGETRIIEKTEEKIIFCGFSIRFRLDNKMLKSYLYFALKQNEEMTRKKSSGSIMPNISQDSLKDISIMIPPTLILQKFNKIVSSIFSNIIKNQQENACLAKLRDFLLPLLMNEQVKMKNVYK